MDESVISSMDESVISRIVESVVKAVEKTSPQVHKCRCNKKITLKTAVNLISKIERKAKEIGVNVVIAIAGEGGNPIAVHCMDDAYIASYDIAVNKAFTAVSLKMSTSALAKLSQPGADLYGVQFTNQGKIVIFPGGEPILVNGKVIGGIGISGGSAAQDGELATYGKNMLMEADSWQ